MKENDILETYDVAPSTNILDVLGNSGYSLETAIADIMDNSITAKAKNIKLFFDSNNNDPKLLIVDDGRGMSLEKLKEASIPANRSQKEKRDEDDLGRYSMGLKSASISFCGKLSMYSKTKNQKANFVTIDFDEITSTKKWVARVMKSEAYSSFINESGTVIIWENLKFLPAKNDLELFKCEMYDKMSSIEKHISHVFSDFIMNNKINFYINNNLIDAWDPFGTKFNNTKITNDFKKKYKNDIIKFKTYIIPLVDSLSDKDRATITGYGLQNQQGFYIYRNGRLISEGGWLNMSGFQYDNKSNYCRIRVDIPSSLDKEFQTNFMKSSITVPFDLLRDFKNVAKSARQDSLNNYNYTKNPKIRSKKLKGQEIPIWYVKTGAKGINLQLNLKHPVIEKLSSEIGARNFNRIISVLTKTIPVARIQNAVGLQSELDQEYIEQLMKDAYEHLEKEGKTKKEIEEILSKTEPFTKNFTQLLDFLKKKEDSNDKQRRKK